MTTTTLDDIRIDSLTVNRRILVVDDSLSIQQDYRKILAPTTEEHADADADLAAAEAELFGGDDEGGGRGTGSPASSPLGRVRFELDAATQGEEGVDRVAEAARDDRPYAMAFVDVRMPPGIDGVETARQLWEADPRLQIVICSAYSDHSWEHIVRTLGPSDNLVILKKPFESIEVRQLALTLTTKWNLARDSATMQKEMEGMIEALTYELDKHGGAAPKPAWRGR
jgi:CheY-like chemotaxis protein